ncbi:bifunctional hydroxymethylpyrimidine kinase/phosphomethylpyrimidine kinase [Comamonas aquatica]|uniref:Hydroxymethylpyrimidine/phosphomethylpyrimidine kinase n=1 Tax=Comamonas aquatica TaxID=225991 RepID=A0AA35D884_9BURK|nr:bifunctional hydroxymethylpyrimidine kinase/phosphomethylpyrimidine kinase [Comamonas aquatica]CAB5663916.1 Hydroxymethylpyrimidine/phosphomethylpyrimidine kinase [Comamonas aquatica]CAB5693316.1 Hydroxymethylpyrimidine/phosphomethylpyrimidine kinase [Comamonas aquatica]CAC9198729.1 Hydroxymethylpyrimidine/phosphomethylpyrimidine kinase [Comamonas aquatica]CAC9689284.1 Hydroxymethylpyrimidine/phosphomethylpyrimidine kinase [Comamonas aquatica]
MAFQPPAVPTAPNTPEDSEAALAQPMCVMSFNACDPSGAGGLTADITTIASVGGHPVAVVTGVVVRDTSHVFSHSAIDDETVTDQARAVLEDIPVRAIKVGFSGSPANLAAIAELASDYPDIPIVSYMPDLSWWQGDGLEEYLDAFQALVMPQTSVLVGNHGTLSRWLLPDWSQSRPPSARDIAKAAEALDVPFVLVTGIPLPDQYIDNVLASTETVIGSSKFEMFDGSFHGAGDTLSAALTALLAAGNDLGAAAQDALEYLDHSLGSGFRPGMGQLIPDRMFWAQPDEAAEAAESDEDSAQPPTDAPPADDEPPPLEGFEMHPDDTKH